MKQFYIFLFTTLTLIGLGSCSTYKSSATPDDVYGTGAVSNDGYSNYSQGNSDYYSTPNDNYVRMRVQDPNRWSTFDDGNYDYYGSGYSALGINSPFSPGIGYGYNSYFGYGSGFGMGYGYSPFFGTGLSFGYGMGYGMGYYDSYYLWNSYYNPYYGGVVVVNGHNAGTSPVTRGASFNPASYRGRSVSTRPAFSGRSASGGQIFSPNTATRSGGRYYNNNSASRPYLNNSSRPAYNNSSRPAQQTQSFSQPTRSAPSSFGSGGGSGGSGGGGGRAGGMSRPGR